MSGQRPHFGGNARAVHGDRVKMTRFDLSANLHAAVIGGTLTLVFAGATAAAQDFAVRRRPHAEPRKCLRPAQSSARPARALRLLGDTRQEPDAAVGRPSQCRGGRTLVGLCDGRRAEVAAATSFTPVTLGYAQPLDSTLFFRGISFCQNGAGRVQNLTHANNKVKGIKSYK